MLSHQFFLVSQTILLFQSLFSMVYKMVQLTPKSECIYSKQDFLDIKHFTVIINFEAQSAVWVCHCQSLDPSLIYAGTARSQPFGWSQLERYCKGKLVALPRNIRLGEVTNIAKLSVLSHYMNTYGRKICMICAVF